MSKVVKKLSNLLSVNSGSGQNQSSRRRANRSRRNMRRRRTVRTTFSRRPRTVSNPAWGRSLPAAYASHVRPRFNVMSRTATSARVAGCDLVYPMPDTIVTDSGDSLFVVIPANPAYWSGTRIAQFAPAYMNYRPISMTFSYIPQVAVTQQGTVFMGTLWNGASPASNIQQSLFTSNGGCLTQCYVPCDTRISLGANLQQNLYTLNGDLNPDTNPFLFLAGIRGSDVVPGYFYVTYMYEFKNPIGQSWEYGVTSPLSTLPPNQPNASLVLLTKSGNFGPGTIFDYELDGVKYRGSAVTLDPDSKFIMFSNGQASMSANSSQVQALRVRAAGVSDQTFNLNEFIHVPYGQDKGSNQRIMLFRGSGDSMNIRALSSGGTADRDECWIVQVTNINADTSPVFVDLLNGNGESTISFELDRWAQPSSAAIDLGSIRYSSLNTFALKDF